MVKGSAVFTQINLLSSDGNERENFTKYFLYFLSTLN